MECCPICDGEVESSRLEEHVNLCFQRHSVPPAPEQQFAEPIEKLPNETWSAYYGRKGATYWGRSRSPTPQEPQITPQIPQMIPQQTPCPIPAHLKDNPFILRCPYKDDCGYMEARDFPYHSRELHSNDPNQFFVCPICLLESEEEDFQDNLLQHLANRHADLQHSSFDVIEHPIVHSKAIGDSYNEESLQTNLDIECAICFEDLCRGNAVYRMNCFCIYHSPCIEKWFQTHQQKRCPVHGNDFFSM